MAVDIKKISSLQVLYTPMPHYSSSWINVAHDNHSFNEWAYNEKRKFLRELAILSSIFVGLLILALRPFGFRTFLNVLGHDNIFSLLLVVSAIAVIFVILQRLGLIFPDQREEE